MLSSSPTVADGRRLRRFHESDIRVSTTQGRNISLMRQNIFLLTEIRLNFMRNTNWGVAIKSETLHLRAKLSPPLYFLVGMVQVITPNKNNGLNRLILSQEKKKK